MSCLVSLPFGYIISKTFHNLLLRYQCFLSPICELCNRENKSLFFFFACFIFQCFSKPTLCDVTECTDISPRLVTTHRACCLLNSLRPPALCPPYKHVIPDSTNYKAKTHCFLWQAVNKGLNTVFWRSVFFISLFSTEV